MCSQIISYGHPNRLTATFSVSHQPGSDEGWEFRKTYLSISVLSYCF
ncbi:hypothetical protein KC19_12G100800 [Ceratodon purpureus]|uniref:Uncharacterized protein n=1 Tax=Ceratodon purpureus TaxID=3225 RepID=A0A8T0G5K9_CERPU|nr:hypothetical protein KC19_12G100800 [Ceratodon purpureus]